MPSELGALVWVPIAADALASGYLALLAGASLLPAKRPANLVERRSTTRFAVVIPAHNEEDMLAKTLLSVLSQDYPADHIEVHVIADNCSDATATVARAFKGVRVHERHDLTNTGKGAALAWLFDELLPSSQIDAYAFIDADSTIDTDFLSVMDQRLAAGADCLQASYRVQDADSHPLVSLRAIAFALFHDLRGRGKARLGLSSGLWGNGMVFSRETLQLVPWRSFSATEDAEQHLRLIVAGKKVEYEGSVRVYGYMPANLGAARDQQKRWEGGRLQIARAYWRQLLAAGFKQRSAVPIAALVDIALPPLSIHLLLGVGMLPIAWLAGGQTALAATTACLAGLGAYFGIGMATARLPRRAYASLLYAPGYIGWKALLFIREMFRKEEAEWVRTARAPSAPLRRG